MAKKILAVDDERHIVRLVEVNLQRAGYEVVTASNGLKALEELRSSSRPDLILLDLMMPVMDGTQLQEHLARDDELADIPVLVCSASGERARRQPHAVGFLPKPVDPPALLDAVHRYC